jgi:hypothetical protein
VSAQRQAAGSANGKSIALPYRLEADRVSFTVPLQAYGLVVITTAAR